MLELPADIKFDDATCYGYQYRSDGTDYKIMSFRTAESDCPGLGEVWSDPARPQSWCVLATFSEGAQLW